MYATTQPDSTIEEFLRQPTVEEADRQEMMAWQAEIDGVRIDSAAWEAGATDVAPIDHDRYDLDFVASRRW